MKHVRLWAALMGSLLLISLAAFAQSDNATVSGVVTDPTGAVIPNAKVVIKNQSTGLTRETATNESGIYVIPTVPPGYYTVTVEATGFKKHESKDNKVDPGVPANFSATLQVGALTETVEVTATVTTLQSETGALGKLIEGSQLTEIPLNGRNPIFLALLKPGVRGSTLAGFSFNMTQGGLNMNGSRTQDILFTFDGAVAIRTRANGTSIGAADLDSAQEVQILTASYGAEFGRAAGGQIRIVTKSGGPNLHGVLYEYVRNYALDANSWSRNRNGPFKDGLGYRNPFKFNQFGFNVTGPIFIPKLFNRDRRKIFFTYSEEWVRQRQESTGLRSTLSPLMKKGDFSELLKQSIWFNTAKIIKDPSTGAPFPNNIIPVTKQSPNGMALLKMYPDPNLAVPQGTSNWLGTVGLPVNQRKDSFGVDILPSQKDNIRWRGFLYHYIDPNPFQTGFLYSTRTYDRPNQTTSLNWTHTFSPTLISETTLTASRDQVFILMTFDNPAFSRATYGINYPFIFSAATKDRPDKIPTVAIQGSPFQEITGTPYPSSSKGPIYVASSNLTKIINNHMVKFGFSVEKAGQNDYDQINIQGVPGSPDNQNGRFEFNDARVGGSGVAVGDVALGLFHNYAEIGTRSYTPYRGWMYEWFAQDEWKATPKLKVIYGVRHTILQPYYSLWRNMTIFDPKYYDPAKAVQVDPKTGNPIAGTGDPYNGIIIPGDGWTAGAKGRVPIATTGEFDSKFVGEPKYYSKIDYGNFQPRVGIAYMLNPKTVLRAGSGKFTTRVPVSDSVFLGGNPPLQPMASVATGLVDNPGGGAKATFPLSVNSQAKIFHSPQAYTWNLTLERDIGFSTVVDVSYVGRRGLFNLREKNINQPPLGTVQANPGININALRPYKGYGAIRMTFNDANSMYNGFQLGVTRRYTGGLSYGLAYTLSKCEDSGSSPRDVIPNLYDASQVWGPCTYDTRHVAVINSIYELPFFRKADSRLLRGALGGWRISGVAQFQSGTPFTVGTTTDYAGIGAGSGNQYGYFWKYAGYGQSPTYPRQFAAGGTSDPAQWLQVRDSSNALLFTAPAAGTIVNDRLRDYFYNPGFQNWNLGLFKEFSITEQQKLLFRVEVFNFPNHPNWSGATSDPTSGSFGKVTGKSSERNVQFSMRYRF